MYISITKVSQWTERECHSFTLRVVSGTGKGGKRLEWWSRLRQHSSVQFSRSVVSHSFRPHGLQHARLPCPSPTPRVYPNSCLSSRWCHPIISSSVIPSPPAFNLSQHQGLFTWVSSSHQVAKVLEFQLNISPSNEYSRLISLRMDWLDLLDPIQGTLKSLLQHHSSEVTIVLCSAFFIVQLSHLHMTTGAQTCIISKTMKPPCPDRHSVGDAYMFDILCTYLDFKWFSLKSNINSIPWPSFNSDLWDCLATLKVKVPGTSAFWNAALKPKRRAPGTEETLL